MCILGFWVASQYLFGQACSPLQISHPKGLLDYIGLGQRRSTQLSQECLSHLSWNYTVQRQQGGKDKAMTNQSHSRMDEHLTGTSYVATHSLKRVLFIRVNSLFGAVGGLHLALVICRPHK